MRVNSTSVLGLRGDGMRAGNTQPRTKRVLDKQGGRGHGLVCHDEAIQLLRHWLKQGPNHIISLHVPHRISQSMNGENNSCID